MTSKEVMVILRLNRGAFWRFIQDNPTFPKPVIAGKTSKGTPIKRYRTREVAIFLELMERSDTHDETARKPGKRP